MATGVGADTGNASSKTGTTTGSRVIYGLEELRQYDVGNAEDLLRRLPGGARLLEEADSAAEKRGLGQGQELILIDGERLPSKSTDVSSYLRLIPKEAVARIEFASGGNGGQGAGTFANLVLVENRTGVATGTWEADLYFSDYGYLDAGGLLTFAGTVGSWDFRVGGGIDKFGISDSGWADRTRYEIFSDPGGQPLQDRPQDWSKRRTRYQTTANLAYRSRSQSRFALNASLATSEFTEDSNTRVTRLGPAGDARATGTEATAKVLVDPLDYEISANFVKPFSASSELNILALRRSEEQPLLQNRWACDDCTVGDPETREISRNLTDKLAEENILRSTFSWSGGSSSHLAAGIELASNTLTQDFQVFLDTDGDGVVEPVAFPTSFAIVEELRIEPFVSWSRAAGRWSVQSWLVSEHSSVKHNFDFARRPSYQFIKPRLLVTYDLTDTAVAEMSLERRIGQLELTEFVPSFDFQDSEIEPGNPSLEPEEIVVAEAAYVRRLRNDSGNVELRTFYHYYVTHNDKKIIALDPGGNPVSATGDIGRARVFGGEIKLGVRLDDLGLQGQLLDARFRRNFSSVTEAFTGAERRIRNLYKTELAFRFRHDLNELGLGYELRYLDRNGGLVAHELSNFTQTWTGAVLDVSIEKRLSGRMSLNLAGFGLLGNREYRERSLYSDGATHGAIARREQYSEVRDRRFKLSLRGSF